jgi:RNA polymerase sigma factor (sigma-70 family)
MDYKGDIFYIKQVLSGNINAFSHIVDRHKNRAFNLAYRICGNHEDAEEVAQDAFMKAYHSLKSFRMKSSFTTWLYRIVYNTAISFVRAKKKGILSIEDFPADATDFIGDNPHEEEAEKEFRSSLINFALQKISDEERGLITLFYYDEMSSEEISDITGISRANIKVRLFRARKKIYDIIQKEENKKTMQYETRFSLKH